MEPIVKPEFKKMMQNIIYSLKNGMKTIYDVLVDVQNVVDSQTEWLNENGKKLADNEKERIAAEEVRHNKEQIRITNEKHRMIAEGSDDPDSEYYEYGRCANERKRMKSIVGITFPNDSETTMTMDVDTADGSGDSFDVPFATENHSGVMTAEDKTFVEGLKGGNFKEMSTPEVVSLSFVDQDEKVLLSEVEIEAADEHHAGVMSAADKKKLNGIESVKRTNIGYEVGQKYNQGDVYTWGDNSILTPIIHQTGSNRFQMFIHFGYHKVYALYTSSNGQPWTCQKVYNESDTSDEAEAVKAIFHDNLASQSLAGLMSRLDKTKLDALEEAVELPTTSGTSFVQSNFYTIGGKLVTDIAYYTETIIQPGSGIVKHYCMAAYMGGKYYKYYEGRTTSGKNTFDYSDTFTEANVPSDIASLFQATATQSGLMSSSDKAKLDSVCTTSILNLNGTATINVPNNSLVRVTRTADNCTISNVTNVSIHNGLFGKQFKQYYSGNDSGVILFDNLVGDIVFVPTLSSESGETTLLIEIFKLN